MGQRGSRNQTPVTPVVVGESPQANETNNSESTPIPQDLRICITPRREENLYSKISYTPMGELTHQYKYYCPVCMSYFMDIMRSSCCGNYTCVECCAEYLNKHNCSVNCANDILSQAPYPTACPHCTTPNFTPVLVHLSDTIRDYHDTPNRNSGLASPMRIGDSFEDMKRKMRPYVDNTMAELTNIDENATNSPTPALSPHPSRRAIAPADAQPSSITPRTTFHAIKQVADQFVGSILGGSYSVGNDSPQQ